jgi:ATP-dependent helicase/nuclease subunit A
MATAVAHDRLTDQQRAAVVRRQASVVLTSGAGCGKTTVLTERFLSHLRDDGAEVGQVVAITFTDRAARQMRQRIRAAVLTELGAPGPEDEAERWARHLRDLETSQVSTIHAFCGNLLRQHAVEAGLDPHFEVLEDYLAANLESEALTACLQRLLTSAAEPGEDLRQLILLYGWRGTVEAVQHLMGDCDDSLWSEWLRSDAAEVSAVWTGPVRQALLSEYIRFLLTASPKIARCLWLLRTTACHGPKMGGRVALILEQAPRLASSADLAAAIAELTEAAKVTGTERAKAWPSEEAYEAVKDALEKFRKELPAHLDLFLNPPEDLPATATVGQRFLRVAQEAVQAYRQLKKRNGCVDFQDLLVLARDLLRDHPQVRERLQRRYRFVLIDELQDTDPVQMELVEHLCGAQLTHGKLFAVGDHKQSIYRFRGADVHLFQDLRRRMPLEGRLGLTQNFRSQPAILDFINALLGPGSAEASSGLEDYEPLQTDKPQVNPGACVEFLWAPRLPKEAVTEARRREADWLAGRITAMLKDGVRLVVDRSAQVPALRPVRPGDIVLLFRAMSNVALYEAALREHGLDYYLVGGRAFFAQQEIYDLLNLLRALENPQDAVSLAGTLRAPFCCLSDEALFVLAQHSGGIWAGLHDPATVAGLPAEQQPRAERARRGLDRWRGLKDRLPIARLLGEVFADTGFDAATQFEFLGDRKLANLWKLTDLARNFDRSGLFGLADFIQRLGDLVRTQPREEQAATQPENADVVRLMTIHQAKGLEFPVVIVPDVCSVAGSSRTPVALWDGRLGCVVRPPADDPPPFPPFGRRLWEKAEEIDNWREELRTLYVACTRAEDYLILSAALPPDYSPANAWMLQIAQRFDLRSGECLNAGSLEGKQPKVLVSEAPSSGGKPGALAPGAGLGKDLRGLTPPARLAIPHDKLPPRPMATLEAPYLSDAVDGSDLVAWVSPRDHLVPNEGPETSRYDRMIRQVLEHWDIKDPEGWRLPLQREWRSQAEEAGADGPSTKVIQMLTRFAQSGVRGQLAAAHRVHWNVEFLLKVSLEEAQTGDTTPGIIRGVIDCLWQDAQKDWHLLALVTDTPESAVGQADWRKGAAGLRAGARAVQQSLGLWPKSLNCYCFGDGQLHAVEVKAEM